MLAPDRATKLQMGLATLTAALEIGDDPATGGVPRPPIPALGP
jgi:hypothetical protein